MHRLLFPGSLAFAVGLATGCALLGAGTPALGEPSPLGGDSIHEEASAPADLWTVLAGAAGLRAEDPTAFEAWGHHISCSEYEMGLTHYLNGREHTPELEAAWQARLEEQFLALRWLEETRRAEEPEFRLRARLALRERLSNLVLDGTAAGLRVTDEEVREYYEQNRERFEQPPMVEVRMILVPALEEAERILEKLAEGESFSDLAAARSMHDSASSFGRLPPFPRGTYNQRFEEKAFEMQPGTTGHVETGAGVFIIRKVANIPAVVTPFEQVRSGLRTELERQRRTAFRASQVEKMRQELTPTAPEEDQPAE